MDKQFLPLDDYREAFELITELAADFINASMGMSFAPSQQDRKEFESKCAYVMAMHDALRTMNTIRFRSDPQQERREPRNRYE